MSVMEDDAWKAVLTRDRRCDGGSSTPCPQRRFIATPLVLLAARLATM